MASSFSFSTSTSGNAHGSRCFASMRAFASALSAFTKVSVITIGGIRFAVNVVPTLSKFSSSSSTKDAFFSRKNLRSANSSATCSGVKSRVTVPTVTFRCTAVLLCFVSITVFPCTTSDMDFCFTSELDFCFSAVSCSEAMDSAFLCTALSLASCLEIGAAFLLTGFAAS